VAKSEYRDLELELREWPDFFEKPNRDCYQSEGILGVLYRSLDPRPVSERFQEQEYLTSVQRDYKFNERILSLCADRSKMHSYLTAVYTSVVFPMTKALKKVMLYFGFLSEAEMFTTDLHYRMVAVPD
jgi:hypothetical protein